eukprot:PLAT3921.1.p1 GENE.PLAT3921.1~~PLAT3921.1.p1  ORF type:complete len:780 (-),score=296.59 PLAT3921.1:70-2409(-)
MDAVAGPPLPGATVPVEGKEPLSLHEDRNGRPPPSASPAGTGMPARPSSKHGSRRAARRPGAFTRGSTRRRQSVSHKGVLPFTPASIRIRSAVDVTMAAHMAATRHKGHVAPSAPAEVAVAGPPSAASSRLSAEEEKDGAAAAASRPAAAVGAGHATPIHVRAVESDDDGSLVADEHAEEGEDERELSPILAKLQLFLYFLLMGSVSLALTRVTLASSSVAASAATFTAEWALRRGGLCGLIIYPYALAVPTVPPRRLVLLGCLFVAVDASLLLGMLTAAPAERLLWLDASKTSSAFKLAQALFWVATYAIQFGAIPFLFWRWRAEVEALTASQSSAHNPFASAAGGVAILTVAATLAANVARGYGFDILSAALALGLLVAAVVWRDRHSGTVGHLGYVLLFTVAQLGLAVLPAAMLSLVQALSTGSLLGLLILVIYELFMAIGMRLLRSMARFATAAQFELPLTLSLDLFDALFIDLVYVLFEPFTPLFWIVCTAGFARDLLRQSGLTAQWTAALMQRGAPLDAQHKLRLLQDLMFDVEQNTFIKRCALLTVPLLLLLDAVLPYGVATVSLGEHFQALPTLGGYATLLAVQELSFWLSGRMLHARLLSQQNAIAPMHLPSVRSMVLGHRDDGVVDEKGGVAPVGSDSDSDGDDAGDDAAGSSVAGESGGERESGDGVTAADGTLVVPSDAAGAWLTAKAGVRLFHHSVEARRLGGRKLSMFSVLMSYQLQREHLLDGAAQWELSHYWMQHRWYFMAVITYVVSNGVVGVSFLKRNIEF